jgi:hypothetical protein
MSDSLEIEHTALAGVSGLETVLFGGAIRRNIRNKKSRFYSLLPRYGVEGSARAIVANLWLLPAIFVLIVSVILDVLSKPNDPARVLSYVLFGVFAGCCLVMILRAVSAARSGSRFRRS